jgi:gamma-glutamyl-gamma-aminobutyrate hydrolase PuuD
VITINKAKKKKTIHEVYLSTNSILMDETGKNKKFFYNYYQHQVKDQIAPKIMIKPLKSSFKSD